MANTTLFFKNKRNYSVGAITFDLILSESHSMNTNVSQHPVEDGSNIADHIKNELRQGSLSGFVTNHSLYENEIVTNRALDVYNKFYDLWQKKELVTIVTCLDVYENCAIQVSADRDSKDGESITINVSFQEVKIVKLQEIELEISVKLKDMKSDSNRQSSKKLDLGKTNAYDYYGRRELMRYGG